MLGRYQKANRESHEIGFTHLPHTCPISRLTLPMRPTTRSDTCAKSVGVEGACHQILPLLNQISLAGHSIDPCVDLRPPDPPYSHVHTSAMARRILLTTATACRASSLLGLPPLRTAAGSSWEKKGG